MMKLSDGPCKVSQICGCGNCKIVFDIAGGSLNPTLNDAQIKSQQLVGIFNSVVGGIG